MSRLSISLLLSNQVINPFLPSLHFFSLIHKWSRSPETGVSLPCPARSRRLVCLLPADTGRPGQSSPCLEVLRLGTVRRLQVCAEFVHVVERLCEESPTGVDLHQGQVIQLNVRENSWFSF